MDACTTCLSSSVCYSAHKSTNEMYERTKRMGIPTIFDRWETQQPQCGFGMQGICCQLCSHGPCRITSRAERAICGATADTIVARNLLRLAVHGAAAYSHHLEELAKTLKATAQGKTPFTIGDEQKLREVASALGLDAKKPAKELAIALANAVLAELRKGSEEPLALLEAFAPASRKEAWSKLGVIPGGVLSEIRDALTKSMTSIDTDPVDLLLTAVRLALATGYMGLVGTITVQDILLGTPALTQSEADLGVIDPDTVNIVAHGHVPLMATAVLQAIRDPELQKLAREAGAKGIKVYGSMCTGQELMQRSAASAQGFAGQLSNWLAQEYYVATGAVDLVMMDMNCSTPGLKTTADHFHTKLVSVDRIVRMEGVEDHVDYDPEKVAQQARQLVKMAIEAYKQRGRDVYIPPYKAKVVAGFGVETILKALGGKLDPLLDAVKQGAVRGIAAVVGCTNNRNGHDFKALTIMREFLRNNVLVISAGCTSSAAEIEGLMDPAAVDLCGDSLKTVCRTLGIPPVLNFGSCVDIGRIGVAVTAIANALGVDPSSLPVVASAPEYLEQKAVADGIFAVSFGLLTHIGPVPPVTGSELVTKILTQDIEQLLGGRVLVEEDPDKAVKAMVEHINTKRKALGI
ncbi:anaerobic carbon-monoxide dehydrogenase catalytic subunit [Thermanaeromonas sp. C210]|uniref:anaerobic carbon-monoxide dehydrogenase catalytic subunit n=1 Tax=Thermanaeromonas sp. C210 TaxID=2731925 RepID=UPI00155CA085|nr:anaerobic carbon-monoxide dehydrogenase catalytic subunit [Thermanaeromonas sp. C210]GFN22148.1 carbon monoxide dehydrogenase [Thermanaeromonas sp. C210]